ncbi:MAG TPA: hypothetical protein VFF65_11820 [Phycisphaerales bacterium]|nr:hypothetical protein [Phycisphaerales bacterium]
MGDQPQRQTVAPAGFERFAFAIDLPAPLGRLETPAVAADFDDPHQAAPLAVWSDPSTGALVVIAGRPALSAKHGGVLQWVRALAEHFKLDLQHVLVREVGSPPTHPGVTAFGSQRRDGAKHSFMLAAFEDGGWFITAHASCPADSWNAIGNAVAAAVESVTLLKPRGDTCPVDAPQQTGYLIKPSPSKAQKEYERHYDQRKASRAPAVSRAAELIGKGKFDEAEAAVHAVERSIDADVDMSRLYERRLREVVAAGAGRAKVESVFRRALRWAQSCYPEPHTEVEAENYEAGRAEDRARLIAVLGYDPDTAGSRP